MFFSYASNCILCACRLYEDISTTKAKRNKPPLTVGQFNLEVRAAFNEFMLSVFGNYRRFLDPDDDFEFDVEGFTSADPKTSAFLQLFRGSQMFEAWCRERTALAQKNFSCHNQFESRVSTKRRKKGGGDEEEEELEVGYGSKSAKVRLEEEDSVGVWVDRWFELDGDFLKIFKIDPSTGKPMAADLQGGEDGASSGAAETGEPSGSARVGEDRTGQCRQSPTAVIPCEFTTTSDPKTTRDDAPFAFRIDVDTSQTTSHCGWMTKQGGFRKSWKRRWFQMQLHGTELAYYDEPGGAQKGMIKLDECPECKTSDNDVLQVELHHRDPVTHKIRCAQSMIPFTNLDL
eukprot:SAG31_NODE_354_length_17223_cov_18.708771_17_plen_345_part_00